MLDQTRLPAEEVYIETKDFTVVADAIRQLRVRGAPAIGVAGAYGIALGALAVEDKSVEGFRARLKEIIETVTSTRPTARNLFWAAERMQSVLSSSQDVAGARQSLIAEAVSIHRKESEYSRMVSELGSELIVDGSTVLTHCNTGPLATTGYGTAFGVILAAARQGKRVRVLVDETRPLLQGSRLTTWELKKAGIPSTLITDSMAGHFMSKGQVNCVIVGADCIAANGDTANKIGTYGVAVLAGAHGIPFYVAAPTSTIDVSKKTGVDIIIEERRPDEVTHIQGIRIAPDDIEVANPAFDVTPARLITAIITDRGVLRGPFVRGISAIVRARAVTGADEG